MRKKIVVADNFYADPDAVRRTALNDTFKDFGKYNYPGWQASKMIKSSQLWPRFESILGAPLCRGADRFAFGAFRVISEQTGKLVKVHADTIVDWAAMVYLSPDAPSDGGTGFFRHKATGLTGPPTEERARKLGYPDRASFEENVVRPDMANLDRWELVGQVAPRYNRFVAFRGCELYHAPLRGWGDSPGNARMTHSFFFDEDRSVAPESAFTVITAGRSPS